MHKYFENRVPAESPTVQIYNIENPFVKRSGNFFYKKYKKIWAFVEKFILLSLIVCGFVRDAAHETL